MGEFSGFALVPEQGAIPQKHQLDPDMQRRIEAMAARVDIRDNAAVMGFGARGRRRKWERFRISRWNRCSGRISSRWKA